MLGNQYFVDKTKVLEEGMAAFPSLYLEGAAASGKSTAVQMLLQKHPEVTGVFVDVNAEDGEAFAGKLETAGKWMESGMVWVVFEDLTGNEDADKIGLIVDFVVHLPENGKVILVGRQKPSVELLELLWKRKMEIIPQEAFLFSEREARVFLKNVKCSLNAAEVYAETGGWAGCVDMMVRLWERDREKTVRELRKCYEIREYVQQVIVGSLRYEERELLRNVSELPWMDEELFCRSRNIYGRKNILEDLTRKGLLVRNGQSERWSIAPLARYCFEGDGQYERIAEAAGWYEEHGYVEEALQCFGKMNSEAEYRRCMTEHFGQIPFSQIDYRVVAAWDEYSPELCYLRGMYCYEQQDFAGLRREIERLKAAGLNGYLEQEILLNLQFASPDISLEDWIDMVEAKLPQKFRLYHILGNSHTYLCGVRDLTRMFALTKKEENRRMRIWKAAFGEAEWRSYCFAKMEYYLETLRGDQISQEEWDMLSQERSVPSLCLSFMIQRLLPDKNTGNLREDAEKSIRSNLGQVHER